MKVIQPNCRIQFTAEDIDFIVSVLGDRRGQRECLTGLLADEASRDAILDDETLYQALLEQRSCLRVSHHFYFYVLVRHALRRAGIENRAVADYVAEMLTEFSQVERLNVKVSGQAQQLEYFFEMMAALRKADDRTSFMIQAHIGNHSLFLAGVFPERIRYRAEKKGFPDLSYFEEIGRRSYRAVSDHQMAHRLELSPIFHTLAEQFQPTRRALNDLTDRLLSIGDPDYDLNRLLLPKPSAGA